MCHLYSNASLLSKCLSLSLSLTENNDEMVSFACRWVEENFAELVKLFHNSGWNTSHILLRVNEWRYQVTVTE